MASRSTDLKVTIDADAAKLEREIQRTIRSTRRMEDQLWQAEHAAEALDRELEQGLAESARKSAQAQEQLGRGMVAFGAATVAGLALATKAAIDWESAWAGVTKTVDGSPEQMAALEQELRGLATTLPTTHAEIAAVAEAAGQLGVQRDAVAAFTKTMIDLGETTNLTADAAATAIAQLGNVLGFDLKNDVDNFGAALVALGNDGASTEADILSMAQRIGGAGAAIGLSTQDVLGFAAALSNVGIEAEAGGSSISKVLIDIAESVDTGNEKLATFAEVAGMSAEEFTRAFEADPARAIAAFIEGLGGVEAAGGSVFATLEALGLSEIRVRDALLRLSQSTRGVTTDLNLSGEAWSDNTALITEAEKRYETTEAKIQIAKNALVDLAIDIGGVVLPYVADLADGIASVFRWFSDLPAPIVTAGTILAGIAGVVALLGGGFLLLAPRIAAAQAVMATMATTSPALAAGLSTVGSAASKVALGLGALGALVGVFQLLKMTADDFEVGSGAAAEALQNLQDGVSSELINRIVQLNGELDSADKYLGFIPKHLDGWTTSARDSAKINAEWAETLNAVDQVLATMVSGGNLEGAEASVRLLGEQLGLSGDEMDAFVEEHLPLYVDGLAASRAGAEEAAGGAEAVGAAVGTLPGQVDPATAALEELAARFGITGEDAVKAAEQMIDEWRDAIGEFVSITGAYDTALSDKETREQETAQATADATEDQTDSWEDYVGDVAVTVEEYLEQLRIMVENQEDWRANMVMLTGRVSDEMLGYLASLGPEGADLVALYATMTDEELQEAETLWRQSTDEGVQGIIDELTAGGPVLRAIAAQHGEDVAQSVRDYMIANKVGVAQAAAALGVAIDENILDTHNTTTTVTAPSQANFQSVLKTIRDHFAGVTVPLKFGDPGFGVLGGGGGGGSPSSGGGGWLLPLPRGSYRVGSGLGAGRGHTGQDLPARTGTPIFAARPGRVSRAATVRGSYGNHVFIDHPGGYQTRYAHMSARYVAAGQPVGGGARIGAVGSTGNSTGPHLHFEIRNGGRVLSPRNYMRFARGGPIQGPGGERDDQIPIWASNGEFMHQAPARKYYGDEFMTAINEMRLPKVSHYAYGGGVGVVANGFESRIPREYMRDGDVHIHAPTTSAQRLAQEVVKQQNRADAVAGRV